MLTTLGGTLLSQYLVVSLREEDWKSEARSHSSERASSPYCLWVHVAVSLFPAVSSPAAQSGSWNLGPAFWNALPMGCALLPLGPPVNVTCNIFINSFGSVTETTMVRGLPIPHFHSSVNGRSSPDSRHFLSIALFLLCDHSLSHGRLELMTERLLRLLREVTQCRV